LVDKLPEKMIGAINSERRTLNESSRKPVISAAEEKGTTSIKVYIAT